MDDEGYDDDQPDGCGCLVLLFPIIAVFLLYCLKNY